MKAKTKKIAAKRFKISKNGIIIRRKQNARHLRSHKSKRQLRRYKAGARVVGGMENAIRVLMPYA